MEYLFEVIDVEHYSKDVSLFALIKAVQIVIKNRQISMGKFDKDLVMTEIDVSLVEPYEKQKEDIILPTIQTAQLTTESEVKMINSTVESYLKYSTIMLSKDKVYNILTDFSAGDIGNFNEAVDSYRTIVSNINEEFRRTDNLTNNAIVHSTDEDYINILLESYDSVKNPKFTLSTGLKMFNRLLSEKGGFLIPSYNIIYASINSFKSALLQYCVKWLRKYNSDSFLKKFEETGKIPTILFYSFENTRKENASREFTMETGLNLKDLDSPEEVVKIWKEHYNSTNSIINVATIYGEAGSVKVSDIRKQIHVLNDTGYDVFGVIIDYLELIRAEDEDMRLDNRLKLGFISNALHVMSISDELFVLTAQQMNRSAETSMSDLRQKEATDIIRQVGGRQFIGEAYAIDKPVDLSMYIALERSIFDNKLYLTVKRDKCRYKRTEVDYFVQELKGGFYIEDDFGTDRLTSRNSIEEAGKGAKDVTIKHAEEYNPERGVSELREKKKTTIKATTVIKNDDDLINDMLSSIVQNYSDSHYEGLEDFVKGNYSKQFVTHVDDDTDEYEILFGKLA
jgi:replicative DNA helicase